MTSPSCRTVSPTFARALAHVDRDRIAAGDARLAHASRDDRGMRGLAAAARQDALRREEAVDVLGLGLLAHEDHALARAAALLRGVRVEHDAARRRARRCRQALGQRRASCAGSSVRHEQLLEQQRVDAGRAPVLRAISPSLAHLDRRGHHRARVHLAVAGLQAVEPAALDRELEVLHFLVVRLEPVAQFDELPVELRHFLRHRRDRLRRADAGDDVLALRVHQVLAEDDVLAGRRDCG